jgi:hypothetical protein
MKMACRLSRTEAASYLSWVKASGTSSPVFDQSPGESEVEVGDETERRLNPRFFGDTAYFR